MRAKWLGRAFLAALCALGPAIAGIKWIVAPGGDDFGRVVARTSASVCLLTVDGVLPSDLPLYDPTKPDDPFLTEFARLGVTVHYAYGATTRPPAAVTSILTGQLPSTHNVWSYEDQLDENFITLGEQFASRGNRTAAFSNVPVLTQCGLGAGFQTRVEALAVGAGVLGEKVRQWLESRPEEYIFLWVHYQPRRADSPGEAFATLLRETVEGLRKSRKLEGTFVIATGTHGRQDGDLSVPMLWRIPKRTATGAVRNGPCSTLDIAPTLNAVFHLRTNLKQPGRSLVDPPHKPLYSGHYFSDLVLFERLLPRYRKAVLGIRHHKFGMTMGPGPRDVAVYDFAAEPGFGANRVDTDQGKRLKDYFLPELMKRKERIPAQKIPAVRKPLDPNTRSILEAAFQL